MAHGEEVSEVSVQGITDTDVEAVVDEVARVEGREAHELAAVLGWTAVRMSEVLRWCREAGVLDYDGGWFLGASRGEP